LTRASVISGEGTSKLDSDNSEIEYTHI
jgi:hypothetical protein